MHHNQDLAFRYLQLAEQTKSNAAISAHHYAQAANLLNTVTIPGPNGQEVRLPVAAWKEMQGQDWKNRNQRFLERDKVVEARLKPYSEIAAMGRPFKVDPAVARELEGIANEFMTDPEWKARGIQIYMLLGRPLPLGAGAPQPSVSSMMGAPGGGDPGAMEELRRRQAGGR